MDNIKIFCFLIVFFVTGCSSGYNYYLKKEGLKGTLSYKLDDFIEDNNCRDFLWSKKGVFYKMNDHLIYSYESNCNMNDFFIKECTSYGGVFGYESIKTTWCMKNGIPLWGVNAEYNLFHEKYKTSEKEWLDGIKLLGYESEKEKEERQGREETKSRAEEQRKKMLYESALKGSPADVLKGNIGDKICKMDEEKSKDYKDNPEEWILYFGYIENKANKKILVRYYGHGNKYTHIDDMDNKILWESPQGWWVCE